MSKGLKEVGWGKVMSQTDIKGKRILDRQRPDKGKFNGFQAGTCQVCSRKRKEACVCRLELGMVE